MAIEEVSRNPCGIREANLTALKEFSIEIPDKEADAIHSVKQAVDYIMAQPDAH
ncbi:Acyl carrier protein [Pyrenophora tritici-repentis]|nr:Acyl carrier protein [Pyrenophora tritici-repentis]